MATQFTDTENSKPAMIGTVEEVIQRGGDISPELFEKACKNLYIRLLRGNHLDGVKAIYPIPKNGAYVAAYLSRFSGLPIELEPTPDSLIVDDLVDSGRTLEGVGTPENKKAVLFHKSFLPEGVVSLGSVGSTWLFFPWERDNDIEDAIVREIEYIGEDVTREGLVDTPKRVVRSWEKLYGGYRESPELILSRTFEPEGEGNYPVILKNIEFYSTCEHHLLPFFGHITVAYLPTNRIVGVSKLARLVECFSRRMQIQERLTEQIADAIQEYLKPKGVYVLCEAQHFCMVSRGVEKRDAKMITRTVRGESEWLKAYSLGDFTD